jgi:hypothetical protein
MRLKTHRRGYINNSHEQTGEGVREVKNWILRQGKRGLVYARNHAADIAKLAAVAIKLYNGDTSNLIEAIKTSTEIFGMDELQALKNVIQDKKEEANIVKKIAPENRKVPLVPVKVVPKKSPPIKVIEQRAAPSNNFLSEIQAGKKLKSRASEPRISPQPSSSLSGMLDAIKARRRMINPDEEEQSGIGAKRILLKMAKHHMKDVEKNSHASVDRTLPNSTQYLVGRGKLSNVLGGISTVSGAVSTIPGPHEIVTVPLTVIAGVASGIAKMFGKGKELRGGNIKSIKKIIFDRIVSVRNDMKDGGYIPSLKQLAKEIVMDVLGVGSKMLETKVRSMLGAGLKMPGGGKSKGSGHCGAGLKIPGGRQIKSPDTPLGVRGSARLVESSRRQIKGSGILDISVKFLTKTALPVILKKMGLHLTPRDLTEVQKMVTGIVGTEPLTVKRAIEIAKEIAPHLYRLYKGKMGGTGLKLPGGQKAFTSKLAREIIKL